MTKMLSEEEQEKDKPWIIFIRDDGFFSHAMYWERALMKISNLISVHIPEWEHKALRIIPEKLRTKIVLRDFLKSTSNYIKPDMILVSDSIRKAFDFSSFNVPTIYYGQDTHVFFEEYLKVAKVQDYDYLFIAQKSDVEKFKKNGCKNVYWLPPACDPEIHRCYNIPKIYDLSFVGGMPTEVPVKRGKEIFKRIKIMPNLQSKFNMFVGRKYLYDMAKIYSQSRIVLNMSIQGCLNMRVFEALSCGSLLLTNRTWDGIEELFKDKEHLVFYEDYNLNEIIEKVQYYLTNPEEAGKIAKKGQEEVHKNHTYLHRVKYILNTVLR